MGNGLSRFIVPVNNDGSISIAKRVKVVDAEVRGNYAEILVDGTSAKYLRGRRYASEIELPKAHLSPSQVNTYLRCPLQYFWRYEEGLKIPPVSAITFGIATHRAVEHNYRQKIQSHEDLPTSEVQEVFADEFDALSRDTQWDEGEKPGEVKDEGIRTTELYMKEVAPRVQPELVEQSFEIEFENVEYTLRGIVDVMDTDHVIIDTKTTKRTPSQDVISKDLQMTTYALGHRTLFGEAETGLRMDYVVRNKTPKVVSLSADPRDQHEVDRLLKLVSYVARAIRDKLFFPQIHNFTCNPTGCGYWSVCQDKW